MTFDDIIQFRRSNRKFYPDQPIPKEVVQKALEHASLAPNSSNMQLWEFHWVKMKKRRKNWFMLALIRVQHALLKNCCNRYKKRQMAPTHKMA